MKTIRKLLITIALIFISLGFSSCDLAGKVNPGDFDTYTATLFKSLLGDNELNLHWLFKDATTYGFEKHYEPSLPTPSNSSSLFGNLYINFYFGSINYYNYDELDFDEKMTYNIINDLLDNFNSSTVASKYITNDYLGSYLGYQAQLPILFVEYKFYDEVDIQNYFKFLDLVPETFQKYVEYEIQKSTAGYGMPDFIIDKVISQCSAFVSDLDNHFLITTFPDRVNNLDFITPEQKTEYIATNIQKVKGPLKEGYEYVRDNLGQIRGMATNDKGLYYYQEDNIGQKIYANRFKDETGYDITMEDAIAYINNQINRIRNRLNEIRTLVPNINELAQNVNLMDVTPEEQLEINKTLLNNHFPAIESYPQIYVKYVDASMEEHFSPAAYMTSPIDDFTSEYIYLNNLKIDGDMNYLYTTLAHEGITGHMYQNIYFKSLETNPIRKILKNSGYVEGWATYTEMYSYNYCTEIDPLICEYLKLLDELSGAYYCRIDLGIHYEGWLEADIINLTNTSPETARKIFEQLVEVFTNPQKYYFTYFKFCDMYNRTKDALGSNFNEVEFHKLILDCGPVPLRFIETVVDEYITSKTI